MDYKKLGISDKEIFNEYFSAQDSLSSTNDFATIFLWNRAGEYRISDDGTLFFRIPDADKLRHHIPLVKNGKLSKRTFDAIAAEKDTDAAGRGVEVSQILESDLAGSMGGLVLDPPPMPDRNASDYIYFASELIDFPGKKFHGKRNHVSKFTSVFDYECREYRDGKEADREAVLRIHRNWVASGGHAETFETVALNRALDNFSALGLSGVIICIDGAPAAFSIVSISTRNVGQVQFEKANIKYDGIYSAICNFTAKAFFGGCEFVNRQEDMGIDGLRKSKLSYNPCLILNKYRLEL